MLVRLFVLTLALTASEQSLAQTQVQKAPDVVAGDPNEKICQSITIIGSRLGKKRFCGTRAEWAEKRAQDRNDAERMQSSLNGSMCVPEPTNGKTTC